MVQNVLVSATSSILAESASYNSEESETENAAETFCERQFDLNDQNLELRVNATTAMVEKCDLRNESKQPPIPEKLIIQPDQQLISDRRSPSSLKSPKSPNPEHKKSVSFCDSLGLDLEHVKLFKNDRSCDGNTINDDYSLPTRRLNSSYANRSRTVSPSSSIDFCERHLEKRFALRTTQEVFDIIEAQNVCLETLCSAKMFIWGQVLVKNIALEKEVYLRHTFDGWRSFVETPCNFLYSNVNNHEVFCFSLSLPLDVPVGNCCDICVRYEADGENYWDRNNDENYTLECCEAYMHR